MADEKETKDVKGSRDQLGPKTSFFISFLFWSIVIVPLTMGAFYMLNVIPRIKEKFLPEVTGLGNQYSVVLGLFVGLVLAGIVGYIYSLRARKQAE